MPNPCHLRQASGRWYYRGVEFLRAREHKEWSLTDCISFAVMRERAITDALTNNRHFEQAGFRLLMKKQSR